jgi:MFS family permease
MATDRASFARKTRTAVAELGTSARLSGGMRIPDLRRVELAFFGFNMAEWAISIAIAVYAYGQSGARGVGLVSAIQLIPAAVFAPFASVLGDRYRREVMLLVAYGVQVVTIGATAVALLLDAPAPAVYALAAVAATGITLVRPVHTALLPALSRSPDELTAAFVADSTI